MRSAVNRRTEVRIFPPPHYVDVAQLVAHLTDIQEAASSSLAINTTRVALFESGRWN